MATICTWVQTISYAATQNGHDVYFGTNYDEVNNGAANVYGGRFSSPQFDPPGSLAPGVTYYWRVDEANGIAPPYPTLPYPSASISMARREYERIQLIVLPATNRFLKNVSVQISDLVKGKNRITASNIQDGSPADRRSGKPPPTLFRSGQPEWHKPDVPARMLNLICAARRSACGVAPIMFGNELLQ